MDLSQYKEEKPHRIKRIIWMIVNVTVFRFFPTVYLRSIRNIILRCFGAKIPLKSLVYSSCKIYAPWNLKVGENACIGPDTEIYNKALVTIGDNCIISQGAFLCTASHDITDPTHPLIIAPITMKDKSWVASKAFIGMGVTIGEGAVVGASASVFKSVDDWCVVGGNPAKFIKKRELHE